MSSWHIALEPSNHNIAQERLPKEDTWSGLFPPKTHSHEKTGLKATLPDHQLDLEETLEATLEAQAGRRGSRAKGTQQDPSPAHDVADDVGMADEDLIAVLLLLGVCPVDVVPEGSLDPRSIFIILLGAEEGIMHTEAAWVTLPPGAQGQSGGCSP